MFDLIENVTYHKIFIAILGLHKRKPERKQTYIFNPLDNVGHSTTIPVVLPFKSKMAASHKHVTYIEL